MDHSTKANVRSRNGVPAYSVLGTSMSAPGSKCGRVFPVNIESRTFKTSSICPEEAYRPDLAAKDIATHWARDVV